MTACLEFFSDILLSLFGAGAGVVIGVIWAQVQGSYNRTQQRINFRKQLCSAFQFNLDRINQMVDQLTPIGGAIEIPNYPFDTDPIKHILFSGREIVGTQEEFDRWNWNRYQLDHLNMKIIPLGFSKSEEEHTNHIFVSFLPHLLDSKKSIESIVKELSATD